MKFKDYLKNEVLDIPEPDRDTKCKYCGLGGTKCLCKKKKVAPGKTKVDTYLAPGAIMSLKGV